MAPVGALGSPIAKPGNERDQEVIHDSVDLRKVRNATLLKTRHGVDGHWHLTGGAINLAELFTTVCPIFTVAELLYWHYNSPTLLRKRDHAWGFA